MNSDLDVLKDKYKRLIMNTFYSVHGFDSDLENSILEEVAKLDREWDLEKSKVMQAVKTKEDEWYL